jgi:acyl transferase domain-containing protein
VIEHDEQAEREVTLASYDGDPSEHIAIIGMTGRFPGAKDIEAFWQNLRDGVESITFFTAEELAGSHIDPALLVNPKYVGADGIIEGMDLFDAEFFGISPVEAELMDPQHRLFLECAWELMEQAGYDSESYAGRVGVYGSANLSTYLIRNIMSNPDLRDRATSFQTLITNDKDYVATRVSYKLNLTGPSFSVATLCSSSFVAIHLACQALLGYQCDMALAGAAALQASRNETFFYQEGGIGDPDGHCRAFDAKASGTVSGSGVGIVALKRLEEALQDGDCIHAVIRATALNNDGSVKYSYTAPSAEGQAQVIAEALSLAEVDPETITFVETHGTGTRLGDPIEIQALTSAFRGAGAQKNQFCAIGSVKTNIGHLVNAGGVASLIKTVLALQHRQIPASLNYDEPNPEIDFPSSPFFVATELADWPSDGRPRRAGVSSFGIGGTNVHMIVEEAPEVPPSGPARPWQVLPLSARTEGALEQQTRNLAAYLRAHPDADLADVAFTLQVGRRAMAHRRVLLCRDVADAIAALDAPDDGRALTQFQATKNRPVAFLLPGAAALRPDLSRELYDREPTFREHIDACAELLIPLLGLDLRQALYPAAGRAEQAGATLAQPAVARTALFALEYALAQLWAEWGVKPQALAGDGPGEYVAACLAGVLSPEDALGALAADRPVARERLSEPAVPLLSGATGVWMTAGEATSPATWVWRAERRASADTLRPLLREPEQVLLEVGPGQTLSALAQGHPGRSEHQVILAALGQSPDGRSELESLLGAQARLWLAGVGVDWYGFHAHERRLRLPLPTYPFERKRYWIEPHRPGAQAAAAPAQTDAISKRPDLADWFYAPGWRSAPAPAARAGELEGPWLVFADAHGVGAALAERLRRAGQTVAVARSGAGFLQSAEATYTLNMRQRADYTALAEALVAAGTPPRQIIHLWSLADGEQPDDRFGAAQERGFDSLLFLAQALAEQPSDQAVQLWVVTNHTQQIESADHVSPGQATLLGLCKVIPQENAQVTCRAIDIALRRPLDELGRLLLAEFAADTSEPLVAYRGPRRWLPTFEPLRLDGAGEPLRRPRQGGVYAITSGLSDISLALAQHLTLSARARLLVLEHSAFPPRAQWDSWAGGNGHGKETALKIASVRQLEAAGAEVLVVGADLTDPAQVRAAFAQARERFGALHGLIHAVGDLGDSTFTTILDTDTAGAIRRFEARLRGLETVREALDGQEPDFCLLVSSLSAVLGGVGQAAYAGANIFLDTFAARHGQPWLSVNWDAWEFEAEQQRIAALTPRLAQFAIAPAEGAQAFERILAGAPGAQIVVSTGDLHARMRHWLASESAEEAEQQRPRHPRPQLPTPYVAPTTDMERTLAEIWQATLRIEKIGIDDSFFDLGGDSLIAVKTITRLEKTLQRKVPAANLYQTPSIRALAALLSEDEAASTQQRAAELDQRRAALSRRNTMLHQRLKGRG